MFDDCKAIRRDMKTVAKYLNLKIDKRFHPNENKDRPINLTKIAMGINEWAATNALETQMNCCW